MLKKKITSIIAIGVVGALSFGALAMTGCSSEEPTQDESANVENAEDSDSENRQHRERVPYKAVTTDEEIQTEKENFDQAMEIDVSDEEKESATYKSRNESDQYSYLAGKGDAGLHLGANEISNIKTLELNVFADSPYAMRIVVDIPNKILYSRDIYDSGDHYKQVNDDVINGIKENIVNAKIQDWNNTTVGTAEEQALGTWIMRAELNDGRVAQYTGPMSYDKCPEISLLYNDIGNTMFSL